MKQRVLWQRIAVIAALCFLSIALVAAADGAPMDARLVGALEPMAADLGTAFTYQGRLSKSGAAVTDACDFRFRLYDDAVGGAQIGQQVEETEVEVKDGHFAVRLDFGANAFNGEARWLEIEVKCGSETSFTLLSPRTSILPGPYALALPGLWTRQHDISPNLIGGVAANSVKEGAWGATIGGGGTRWQPNRVTDNYGVIAGGEGNRTGNDNEIFDDAEFSTIGGGLKNKAVGGYSTIAGGMGNRAEGFNATIAGGIENRVTGEYNATVGGGYGNVASGVDATVAGGNANEAGGWATTVSGGVSNTITADVAVIGGGLRNEIFGSVSTIAGGEGHTINHDYGAIGGGLNNQVYAHFGVIAGGGGWKSEQGNIVWDQYGAIGGGHDNKAGDDDPDIESAMGATVGGGMSNRAFGRTSTVSGGENNEAGDEGATVSGGRNNKAAYNLATVGGGQMNIAGGSFATVAGGSGNKASHTGATVGGGSGNEASGLYATVPGGQSNKAAGMYSFAAGYAASAQHAGTFVWADRQSSPFSSTAENQFLIQASGGVGIGTNAPQAALDVAGRTRTDVLEIDGGLDLAEPFEIRDPESIQPGMALSIDPDHPGQLRLADRAYDRLVAGCASGANGVNPGLIMAQEGVLEGDVVPVALTGRVYCYADASYGPIHPGDLLTTSDTPGHLMVVQDHNRAQGAIVGKAMSGLDEGKGFVLVLVSLQ
ncbi:MAG: hypothetical protein GXP42_01870 [Chloroflexi bacterium]|nr:hypothetical protein [Chloroflexota bacterium]